MFKKLLHSIGLKPTFIFQNPETGSAEAIESETEAKKSPEQVKTEALMEKLKDVQPDDLAEAALQHFEETEGPAVYEAKIKKDYEGLGSQVIEESMAHFRPHFSNASAELRVTLGKEYENHGEKMSALKEKYGNKLSALKNAVEANAKFLERAEKAKSAAKQPRWNTTKEVAERYAKSKPAYEPNWLEQTTGHVKPEFKEYQIFKLAAQKKLTDYAAKLNDQYMNEEWNDRQYKNLFHRGEYSSLASEFQQGMQAKIEGQLDHLLTTETDPQKIAIGLNDISDEVKRSYESFANADGVIDLKDLREGKQEANRMVDLSKAIDEGLSDQEIFDQMVLNPEQWKAVVSSTLNLIFKNTDDKGLETLAILYANNIRKEENIEFARAKAIISARINRDAELDVEGGLRDASKTLGKLRELDATINGAMVDLQDEIPLSIKGMVLNEKNMLLHGRTLARNIDDVAVVEFMRADQQEKNSILLDPKRSEALFVAIRNIQNEDNENYAVDIDALEELEVKDMVHSRNPDKPTSNDISARKLALRNLADESEWMIEKMGELDQYKNLGDNSPAERMTFADSEENPPSANFDFTDTMKLYSTEYVSVASRSGFNGGDLMKAAAKTWAVLTVVVNVAANKEEIMKGEFGGLAKNPFLLAAGAYLGIDHVSGDVSPVDYVGKSAGDRLTVRMNRALDKLAKGRKAEVKNFVAKENEFDLMEKLSHEDVVALLEHVDERVAESDGKEKPMLKPEDFKAISITPDESEIPTLGDSEAANKIRYDFYKDILQNQANHRELKPNCDLWRT